MLRSQVKKERKLSDVVSSVSVKYIFYTYMSQVNLGRLVLSHLGQYICDGVGCRNCLGSSANAVVSPGSQACCELWSEQSAYSKFDTGTSFHRLLGQSRFQTRLLQRQRRWQEAYRLLGDSGGPLFWKRHTTLPQHPDTHPAMPAGCGLCAAETSGRLKRSGI